METTNRGIIVCLFPPCLISIIRPNKYHSFPYSATDPLFYVLCAVWCVWIETCMNFTITIWLSFIKRRENLSQNLEALVVQIINVRGWINMSWINFWYLNQQSNFTSSSSKSDMLQYWYLDYLYSNHFHNKGIIKGHLWNENIQWNCEIILNLEERKCTG